MADSAIRSVLMTADTVGGVWTYALTLTRALGKRGVAVDLATMGERLSPKQWEEAHTLDNLRVSESTLRLEWMDDPWEDVRRAGDWLLELEQRTKPDIVHLNGYVHGALDWSAPALVVAHSCVLSWWAAVKREEAPASWSRYRRMVRDGLVGADGILAPSRAMLAEVEKQYGCRGGVVIPNASDPDVYAPAAKQPFVFSAGRLWDEAKNISALDEAASGLPWPVYVAGEKTHPNGSRYDAKGVEVLGRLAPFEIRDWMARASIYALPARYEPFGLSILEAAQAGCALVLGDIASLRENWDGAATFVPPDDIDGLRHALRMLIADDEQRLEQAIRARARAIEFTPERMAQNYLDAYRNVTALRNMKTCV